MTETLSAEKKLTVASKTDETYSGNRTVILDNNANDSLTIAGNKILKVTGDLTEILSAEKKLTVASKTDETYSEIEQ